ncbi:MAG: helix-turn-helix domain-containing protein [Dehalococcoidia bacterium]|nr:helix-turn-helix domain-containing protein [Dehalococcoidia bacterium]
MSEQRLTITVPEAAQLLGISRGLAYEMARRGKLPAIRFGKRILVPRSAIERLLQESFSVGMSPGDPSRPIKD